MDLQETGLLGAEPMLTPWRPKEAVSQALSREEEVTASVPQRHPKKVDLSVTTTAGGLFLDNQTATV
jgi:hypothetical protein